MRNDKTEIEYVINSKSPNKKFVSALKVRCSNKGFFFVLKCDDGVSWACSQQFSWQQIAQLLIAVDPNMFGVLEEPLHQVFPQNLKLLGYCIPDWEETH